MTVLSMPPTALPLEVPLPVDPRTLENWACALLQAQQLLGPSVSAAVIGPCLDSIGSTDLAVDSLFEIGLRCPSLLRLRLCNVVLQTTPPSRLQPLPVFAQLDTLSIKIWDVGLDRALSVTEALFFAFSHMPKLRVLRVHDPPRHPHLDLAGNPTSLPTPPFSLETFSYSGALSFPECALIISCSRGTLSELRLQLSADPAAGDEEQLGAAIAQAAPQLRVLHLSAEKCTRLVYCFRPVFAQLARLHTLRLGLGNAPNTSLPAAVGLLAVLPAGIPLHTLQLDQVVLPDDGFATFTNLVRRLIDLPQTRRLTGLFLTGFHIGYGKPREKSDLIEHCRSRRIRCKILR